MRYHRMRGVTEEGHMTFRAIRQWWPNVDPLANGMIDRCDDFLDVSVPALVLGGKCLDITRREPGFLHVTRAWHERNDGDQAPLGNRKANQAAAGPNPHVQATQFCGPWEFCRLRKAPVGHDAFA